MSDEKRWPDIEYVHVDLVGEGEPVTEGERRISEKLAALTAKLEAREQSQDV